MGFLRANFNRLMRTAFAVVVMLCVMCQQVGASTSSGWNYENGELEGPEKWCERYPDCCRRLQSPVNINTRRVLHNRNLESFDTYDYETTDGVDMKLENVDGHTAELVVSGNTSLYLRGGSLPADYKLEQLHFHWGGNNSRGSEHSINRKFFPMEVHFVHRQVGYSSMDQAASRPFGLAVLAFLFKITNETDVSSDLKYDQLIQYLEKIPNPNDEVEIPTFPISDLIPSNFDFYRYLGSLTTPPCYESVIWSIGTEPIPISQEQLDKFRSLYKEAHKHLMNDFRPIQPLNQRTVETTKSPCAA